MEEGDDEACDREGSYSTHVNFIEATHLNEMFDDGNEDWHCGIFLTPVLEGFVGDKATRVFERNVDVEIRDFVNVFDDRHTSLRYDRHRTIFDVISLLEGVGCAVEVVGRGVSSEAGAGV